MNRWHLCAPYRAQTKGKAERFIRYLRESFWVPLSSRLAQEGLIAAALTMLVGVQAFDALAMYGGRKPVLLLDPLIADIAAHPGAPEYWWLYALLLATIIPSLVNLVIGGTSLVRGLPGVPSLLLRYIPERGGVLKWDRMRWTSLPPASPSPPIRSATRATALSVDSDHTLSGKAGQLQA